MGIVDDSDLKVKRSKFIDQIFYVDVTINKLICSTLNIFFQTQGRFVEKLN